MIQLVPILVAVEVNRDADPLSHRPWLSKISLHDFPIPAVRQDESIVRVYAFTLKTQSFQSAIIQSHTQGPAS